MVSLPIVRVYWNRRSRDEVVTVWEVARYEIPFFASGEKWAPLNANTRDYSRNLPESPDYATQVGEGTRA
jgi:hypothetical protein